METRPEPTAFSALREHRLVAAIRAASPEAAQEASVAIARGGIRHIEITFTIPEATRVMRAALDAGAQFLIAPNLSREVAEVARDVGVMYAPGAYTTTEILAARAAGAHLVKVYPVGVAGGPQYIRVIRDPLPDLPMMASGGTTLENMLPFLMAGCMAVGLGAAVCDPALVAAGKWGEITALARAFGQRLRQAYATGTVAKAVP